LTGAKEAEGGRALSYLSDSRGPLGEMTMRFLSCIRFIALFSTGLVAGILLGDRMGATFARPQLDPSAFVQFQQILHVHFVPTMPILIIAAVLSSAIWLFFLRSCSKSVEFLMLALATIGIISVFSVTRTVNVPINNQLMHWKASAPPPDIMELWRPWEQAHTVRTVVAVLAFALQLLASSLASQPAKTRWSA